MTGAPVHLEPRPEDPDRDQELLDRVRAGDGAAFGELYDEHAGAARRLASFLAGPDGADDLVAESFARILDLLGAGGGPTSNFRAYLYTAIRNRYRDNLRTSHERPASDAPWLLDSHEPSAEELVPGIDANGAVAALTSLPGTWQQVLWYLEVEGRKPAEVADLLAMSPVAVSSLAYRAREGLRRAYLDQHLVGASVPEQCRWTRDRLSQYVRDDLSSRASAKVGEHLAGCAGCSAAFAELETLNKKLAALLVPVVLVGAMKALELSGASGTAPAGSLAGALGNRLDGGSGASAGAGSAVGGQVASGFVLADLSARAITVIALVAAGTVAAAATAWAVIAHEDRPVARKPAVEVTATPTPPPTPPATQAPNPVTPSPRPAPPVPEPTVAAPVVEPAGPVADPGPEQPPAAPELVVVRTRSPVAVPISGCGSYGSLTLPRTTGVRYALTAGDGRQGTWAVTATARPGYRIADDAPRRFTGDLGSYVACPLPPSIGAVSKVAQGDPADPWDITVSPLVPGPEPATVQVTYTFTTGVLIKARSGEGWTCREPGGGEVGAGQEYYFPDPATPFTCTFDYTGTAPPPVTMTVFGMDAALQVVEPTGQVTLSTAGVQHDQRTF